MDMSLGHRMLSGRHVLGRCPILLEGWGVSPSLSLSSPAALSSLPVGSAGQSFRCEGPPQQAPLAAAQSGRCGEKHTLREGPLCVPSTLALLTWEPAEAHWLHFSCPQH